MRSPVIAFGILAAAVSPALISAAPASPVLERILSKATQFPHIGARDTPPLVADLAGNVPDSKAVGIPVNTPSAPAPSTSAAKDDPVHREQAIKKAMAKSQNQAKPATPATPATPAMKDRRGWDDDHNRDKNPDHKTAGGNAFSGASSDANGGDVKNGR